MRIGIIGAGSMGILLCQRFQAAGHAVTLFDVPARVAQLKAQGAMGVVGVDGIRADFIPSLITDDYLAAGLQDFVFLATKAQHLPAVAEHIPVLTNGTSPVIGIQNGIPWWYLYGSSSPTSESRLQCLDADGLLERFIRPSQILGCVAYPAAMTESDGRIRHVEGDSFPVGELDGTVSERSTEIAAMFNSAGFRSRVITDIRSEIWLKLLGAVSINPVSALTRASMRDICSFPLTQVLIRTMMEEARGIAQALGVTIRHSIDRRLEGARQVGGHRTSMLQDVENGLPLELDAVMLAVLELAEICGVAAPTIRNIYACAALLNEGLQRPGEPMVPEHT
jgi:2-dehydropantoate 2-reductase